MDITETLYVSTREEWRAWLKAHHETKSEIWFVFYRKATGQPSVSYNDAVEEALCFGWIDGIRKKVDEDRYANRFTPRRPGSGYSQTNKERLARLAADGKVLPELDAVVKANRPEAFKIPEDIQAALKKREGAWAFFKGTSPSYQRIRAAYVDHARDRPEEFEKRLNNLVDKCARGVQTGYGIASYF